MSLFALLPLVHVCPLSPSTFTPLGHTLSVFACLSTPVRPRIDPFLLESINPRLTVVLSHFFQLGYVCSFRPPVLEPLWHAPSLSLPTMPLRSPNTPTRLPSLIWLSSSPSRTKFGKKIRRSSSSTTTTSLPPLTQLQQRFRARARRGTSSRPLSFRHVSASSSATASSKGRTLSKDGPAEDLDVPTLTQTLVNMY